jgi:UDP-glucose 4-epimerase
MSDPSEYIFNIGTGIEISVNQVLNHLREIINPSFEEKHGPPKQGSKEEV